jgi:peptide/nickel transport system substrate-binding protein
MLKMDSLDTIDSNPIGTGPFVLDDFIPDNTVSLVKNSNYWGEEPSIEKIEIVGVATAASMTTSLVSGDLDVGWGIAMSDIASINGSGTVAELVPSSKSQYESWEFDISAPPFDDVRVRQAFAYALDRKRILKDAFYGLGTVSETNNPIADSSPWFSNAGATVYEYDLDKASALFEEAGIMKGTTFTWWGVAGQYPEWDTSGQILQASLSEIGINLEIENNEIGTWVEKFYPSGKSFPGLLVPNRQPRPAEPALALAFFLNGECECNFDDEEMDSLYATALATGDEKKRLVAWGDVQLYLNKMVPALIPLQLVAPAAVSNRVTGVWVEPGGQIHVESAAFVN